MKDSLFDSRVVAGWHEQLVPYDVQDQELAFVQFRAEAARFAFYLVLILRCRGTRLRQASAVVSALCRRQKTLNVAIPYRGGTGPLHLLIDATGIKAEGEGEWNARKHGGRKKRLWRKLHLGMDEQTLEIRAVEVTTSNVGDAPMLPELLEQIPPDQEIATVTADGAYDTRKCHDVIAARGTAAIIPPRKNARPWKPDTAGAVARNEALRACKYLGRAL